MIKIISHTFESDPYPGRPKILFIGLGGSSHTHSWIDLLFDAKLNVRLFSVPGGGVPPPGWNVPTYICDPSIQLPRGLDPGHRQSFYPLPEEAELLEEELRKGLGFRFFLRWTKVLHFGGRFLSMPVVSYDYSIQRDFRARKSRNIKSVAPDAWLSEIVRDWKPDIIHTLGLFDGQGGMFYFEARKRFHLENMGTWILELRGGSDIALRQHNPEIAEQIPDMFSECDQINTDNYSNIAYIEKLGFAKKIASIAPIPATGGMELETNVKKLILPSNRQRIIFWPKAYESVWSKALPVIEAIKLAWDRIKPCTIYMTAINSEAEAWLATLPEEIRRSCQVQMRIPRQQALEMMKQTRVMLAPSLIDGLPNVLMEAMAYAAFPIISPLESITPVVNEYENVLFARNLYPEEIAKALICAMSDDALVDHAAQNNLALAVKLANRSTIALQVKTYYEKLAETEQK